MFVCWYVLNECSVRKITLELQRTIQFSGEIFPPCIIGTSAQPRAFTSNGIAAKYITSAEFGFSYYHNSTAWMTTAIFISWLEEFNALMKKNSRHVLLLLDDFSGHRVNNLSNMNIRFFPPNMTSHVQPCDAGIIKTFKGYFRAQMNNRISSVFKQSEVLKTSSKR